MNRAKMVSPAVLLDVPGSIVWRILSKSYSATTDPWRQVYDKTFEPLYKLKINLTRGVERGISDRYQAGED